MLEDDVKVTKGHHIIFWLGLNLTLIIVTACIIWYNTVAWGQKNYFYLHHPVEVSK